MKGLITPGGEFLRLSPTLSKIQTQNFVRTIFVYFDKHLGIILNEMKMQDLLKAFGWR